MVKKFQKFSRAEPEPQEEDELSDLEIDDQEKVVEEEINDVETMNTRTVKIQEDFKKLMKSNAVDWLETMDITSDQAVNPDLNIDDDIRRELIFYNITLKNTARGINKLRERNQKLNRPDDFFAEMVKSDLQMTKVKKMIVTEQIRIKKFEEKKQKMQNIKFSRAMKHETGKQKMEFKRKTKEGLDSWKKHIKNNPNDYDKLDNFFDGDEKGNKKQSGRGKGKFGKSNNKDRESRDSKYQNSNKSEFGRNKKNAPSQRPGKIKRMIQRNKKNSKKSR